MESQVSRSGEGESKKKGKRGGKTSKGEGGKKTPNKTHIKTKRDLIHAHGKLRLSQRCMKSGGGTPETIEEKEELESRPVSTHKKRRQVVFRRGELWLTAVNRCQEEGGKRGLVASYSNLKGKKPTTKLILKNSQKSWRNLIIERGGVGGELAAGV